MDIKTIFENAEGGVLNYDQFMALASQNNAKFTDLAEGNYVSKQKFDNEIATRDGQITTLNETLTTRDSDLSSLRTQLANAGTDADALATLQNNFSTLQTKYDKDTKAYQKQLRDQQYEFAVREYSNGMKFTSTAAKREFERAMIAKNLQMEDRKIIGADDFVGIYKKDNADSFVAEPAPTPAPQSAQPNAPSFVQPTGNPQPQANENLFGFSFGGVRPRK